MEKLEDLDRARLIAIIQWLTQQLTLWVKSESIEPDKRLIPDQLIAAAITATND